MGLMESPTQRIMREVARAANAAALRSEKSLRELVAEAKASGMIVQGQEAEPKPAPQAGEYPPDRTTYTLEDRLQILEDACVRAAAKGIQRAKASPLFEPAAGMARRHTGNGLEPKRWGGGSKRRKTQPQHPEELQGDKA